MCFLWKIKPIVRSNECYERKYIFSVRKRDYLFTNRRRYNRHKITVVCKIENSWVVTKTWRLRYPNLCGPEQFYIFSGLSANRRSLRVYRLRPSYTGQGLRPRKQGNSQPNTNGRKPWYRSGWRKPWNAVGCARSDSRSSDCPKKFRRLSKFL